MLRRGEDAFPKEGGRIVHVQHAEEGGCQIDLAGQLFYFLRCYLREWMSANVAGGYIEYDPALHKFSMTPEQAIVFAAEGNPHCMQGFFQAVVSDYTDVPKAIDAIRAGEGLPWGDHSECLFCGTERFFRPMYAANLIDSWIPALAGVKEKLESGAKVADE